MTDTAQISAELPCHHCGYDLRAHPQDGKCPECEASVAESLRVSAIPLRPTWAKSDPRWRRRMLAGVWVLALMPLMFLLDLLGLTSRLIIPNVFGFPGSYTLDESFLRWSNVYESLIFCIGIVLLFSKERGRRRDRLDWTRRWGVICSYLVLFLGATEILFISALVTMGIAALFMSMPLQYQPAMTQWFARVSTAYLRYGPHSNYISGLALVACSSITVLLACSPLYDALRSSAPKWLAATLVIPLALFALLILAQVARYALPHFGATPRDVYASAYYFQPRALVSYAQLPLYPIRWGSDLSEFLVEAVKWCSVLTIAVWLSIATLAASWRGRKASSV